MRASRLLRGIPNRSAFLAPFPRSARPARSLPRSLACLAAHSTPQSLIQRRAHSFLAGSQEARSSRAQATARGAATMAKQTTDPSSYANFSEAKVLHSDYEFDVDFDRRVIEGHAILRVEIQTPGASTLVLDSRDLSLTSVLLLPPPGAPGADGKEAAAAGAAAAEALSFATGEAHTALGAPVKITLPAGLAKGATLHIGVRFATSPSASALQFLDPSQTAGGQHPYLFTQCQAIHARSFVPCQDTPAAKMSYTAAVRVPSALRALMSALPVEDVDAGAPLAYLPASARPSAVFRFSQPVPIPPYLLALAVGDLVARDLGPRSCVWSEPSMVEAGAYEFADTSKFLEAGEAIAGPYVWHRYDLLLLPPSFPYGGMENPNITFVTPTLLAGDRSLTNVVAHEIAHSWTGNLVTNVTWEHFWLNEGFTVYLERSILRRLAGEATFQFHAAAGAVDMADDIARYGPEHPFTALVPDLSGGVDPDDAFSKIPYEKGFYFLYYLQQLVGGPDVFQPFLRAYLEEFKFKTASSEQFRAFFTKAFANVPAAQSVDWETWLYKPGPPPVTNEYDTSLGQAAFDLAKRWHTCDVMGIGGKAPEGASAADIAGWSSEQVVAFLDKLAEYRSMTPLHWSISRAMAQIYGLDGSKNCEIRASWYKLAIGAEDAAVLPLVVDLLSTQGRMKFLRPLYRALFKSKMGRQLAVDTFKRCEAGYHPIAQKMVAADLQLRS